MRVGVLVAVRVRGGGSMRSCDFLVEQVRPACETVAGPSESVFSMGASLPHWTQIVMSHARMIFLSGGMLFRASAREKGLSCRLEVRTVSCGVRQLGRMT